MCKRLNIRCRILNMQNIVLILCKLEKETNTYLGLKIVIAYYLIDMECNCIMCNTLEFLIVYIDIAI